MLHEQNLAGLREGIARGVLAVEALPSAPQDQRSGVLERRLEVATTRVHVGKHSLTDVLVRPFVFELGVEDRLQPETGDGRRQGPLHGLEPLVAVLLAECYWKGQGSCKCHTI